MEADQPTTTDFGSYFPDLDMEEFSGWAISQREPIGQQIKHASHHTVGQVPRSATLENPLSEWFPDETPTHGQDEGSIFTFHYLYAPQYGLPEIITASSFTQAHVDASASQSFASSAHDWVTAIQQSTDGATLNDISSPHTVVHGGRNRLYCPVQQSPTMQDDGHSTSYQQSYLQPSGPGGKPTNFGGLQPQHTGLPQMYSGLQPQATRIYDKQLVQPQATGFPGPQRLQVQPQTIQFPDQQQCQPPLQSRPTQGFRQQQQTMLHRAVGQQQQDCQLNSQQTKLLCDYPGCKSKGFLRQRDLTKHQRKHTREVTYDCPAVGCVMTGDRANCLRDKFVSRLRKGHRRPTAWRGPVGNCEMQVQSMDLLTEHLRGHGEVVNMDEKRLVDAVFAAGRA